MTHLRVHNYVHTITHLKLIAVKQTWVIGGNSWWLYISFFERLNNRAKISWLKFIVLQPFWHLNYFEHKQISQRLCAVQLHATHHENLFGNLHLASSCLDAHIFNSLFVIVLTWEVVRVQNILERGNVAAVNGHLLLVWISSNGFQKNRVLRFKEAWNVSRYTSRSQCYASLSFHPLSGICSLRILGLWEVKLPKFKHAWAPHLLFLFLWYLFSILWQSK